MKHTRKRLIQCDTLHTLSVAFTGRVQAARIFGRVKKLQQRLQAAAAVPTLTTEPLSAAIRP